MPRTNLIFDMGLHKGEDTDFYLRKGFDVVAFEADPLLIKFCKLRFADYIDKGRLQIIEGAIAPDLAPKFYPVLSSPWLLDLPGWAAVATGAGAEPSAQRSARSRRGRQVKANSDGVFHPSCECGRASL